MSSNNPRESYFIYMLECDNGSFYTGYTNDLDRRMGEHLSGSAKSSYTRSFRPVSMAACWKIKGSRADAMAIERLIKGLGRQAKEKLVATPSMLKKLSEKIPGKKVSPRALKTKPLEGDE